MINLIIPCFNEQENASFLRYEFDELYARSPDAYRLIFVDDGSSDDTVAALQEAFIGVSHHAHNCEIRIIEKKSNQGMFQAWISAVDSITDKSELCLLLDADLQMSMLELPRFVSKYERSCADVVQGVRSSIGRLKDGRYLLSKTLNVILNYIFLDSARDSKSGHLFAQASVLEDMLRYKKHYKYPQTFVRLSLRTRGYSIAEIDVLFREREHGESFLGKVAIIPALWVLLDVLKAVLEFSFGRSESDIARFSRLRGYVLESSDIIKYAPNWTSRAWRWLYFATLPLHTWHVSGRVRDLYYDLLVSEKWTLTDLTEYQFTRIRKLLRYAYQNNAFYRHHFDMHGFHPSQFKSLADLKNIPYVEKDAIRRLAHFDFFSDGYKAKEMQRIRTSGSTGSPMVVYGNKLQLELRMAATLRGLHWAGWKFGDRSLRLWHQKIGMSATEALKEKLNALISRRKFIPAYEIDRQSADELKKLIEAWKPKFLDGYAESFSLLSRYYDLADTESFSSVVSVMTSAQTLDAKTRSQIEKVFGCKVFDKYGAREFSGIAYEQAHSNGDLAVVGESYILNIDSEGKPALNGDIGEIIVTDLINYDFPLIRYRIGDMAAAAGKKKTVETEELVANQITKISGRTQALIICGNGVVLPGTFFAHFFKEYDRHIKHYQIIQDLEGCFEVKYVTHSDNALDKAIVHDIESRLKEFAGDTNIIFTQTSSLPLTETGKRTVVVSNIDFDFQTLPSNQFKEFKQLHCDKNKCSDK